jgi:hypothetical protein
MSEFFLRTNTIFLIIWTVLVLYVFYQYYKKTDFRKISFTYFIRASLEIFLCGYITVAIVFGIEHLLLLPWMPFGIAVLTRWYELNPLGVIAGCLITLALLFMIYQLITNCENKHLIIRVVLIVLSWLGLFCGGCLSFLYVLSRFTF